MRIAIMCAMAEEAALISEILEEATAVRVAGVDVTRGTAAGHQLALCLSGVGKANAAATAQLMISAFAPEAIINIGLAGNCTPALPLGGAVVAERLAYHDINVPLTLLSPRELMPDAGLARAAAETLAALDIPFVAGTIATGDQFITDSAVRDDIIARTGAACVEMECAAIAQIAVKNDVPFAAIKLMSDHADADAGVDFDDCLAVDAYCARSAAIISKMIRNI